MGNGTPPDAIEILSAKKPTAMHVLKLTCARSLRGRSISAVS